MGELRGKQIQPRDLAHYCYVAGWTDAMHLREAVQVCLAESQGWDHAFNDNTTDLGSVALGQKVRNAETLELYEVVGRPTPGWVTIRHEDGTTEKFPNEARVVLSRDAGVFQINFPAEHIGTSVETNLYDVGANVGRARVMYVARGWQPWAAWNSRICWRDTYVKRAVKGVGNYLGENALLIAPDTDANPRYLTNPILDYSYRVTGQTKALKAAHAALVELKQHTDDPNDARIAEIIKLVAAGISIPKS